MNSLDDWLDSLGLNNTETNESNVPVPVAQEPVVQEPVVEQTLSNISNEDFNDIISGMGFEEPVYESAEEVTETDSEEESEIIGQEDTDNIMVGDVLLLQESQAVHLYANDEVITEPIIQGETVPEEPETIPQEENTNLLPENSSILLRNDATSRFSGAEWFNEIQRTRIILAGLGGIGSYVAYNLARMNPSALFLYDDDIVESTNMSGQMYCIEDINSSKVNAIARMLGKYTTTRNIYAINEKFTSTTEAGDIMICGFDSMEARKTFFESWKRHVMAKPEEERYKCLFIDGRLTIDCFQVLCMTGEDTYEMQQYEQKYLFSDAESDSVVCTLKQTTYLACMIGAFMVNLFTNWVANTLNPVIPYDLPFFTEYDAQNMIFKTVK